MPEWHIDVPGAPDQTPGEALSSGADELLEDPEDQRVAAQLLLTASDATVGDLRNRIEAASPTERRELLDRTRTAAGLPSIARVEAEEAVTFASRPRGDAPLRDSQNRIAALCAEPGCRGYLPDQRFPGEIARVAVTRWYCAAHAADHAEEMRPYSGTKFRLSLSGLVEPIDEAEEAERSRAEREIERRRVERERVQAERRRAAEGRARSERARDERQRSEMPRGLRS